MNTLSPLRIVSCSRCCCCCCLCRLPLHYAQTLETPHCGKILVLGPTADLWPRLSADPPAWQSDSQVDRSPLNRRDLRASVLHIYALLTRLHECNLLEFVNSFAITQRAKSASFSLSLYIYLLCDSLGGCCSVRMQIDW